MAVIQRLRSLDATPGAPVTTGHPGQLAISVPTGGLADMYVANAAGTWESWLAKWRDQPNALAGLDSSGKLAATTIPQATASLMGGGFIAELGDIDTAEPSDTKIVTPLKMVQYIASQGTVVVPATETVAGIAEIATQAETNAGLDDGRIVTPLKLATYVSSYVSNSANLPQASETARGTVELATQGEVIGGSDPLRVVTPAGLSARAATETGTGLAELATQAETNAGTDDARILTPLKLRNFTGAMLGPVTITESLTLSKASPQLLLNALASGQSAIVVSRTNGLARWGFGKDSVAESGSNGGSDFAIIRYDDAGAFLSTALAINRATGLVSVVGNADIGSGSILLQSTASTSTIKVVGNSPRLEFYEADAAVDERLWRIVPSTGSLSIFPRNDADNSGGSAIELVRSGVTFTGMNVNGTCFTTGSLGAGVFSATGATSGKIFASSSAFSLDSSRSGSTSLTHQRFYNPNGQVGSISTNASATAYTTSSDGRLKKNLRDFDAGAILDQIKVWLFDWKVDDTPGYGVIAQDCHPVFPQAITPGDNEEAERWSTDYSKFVPLLLREVQSLRARLAASGM